LFYVLIAVTTLDSVAILVY